MKHAKHFQRVVFLMVAAMAVTACGQKAESSSGEDRHITEAKRAIERNLSDPSSAQYRNVKNYISSVCGEVNAKNKFGGYVGFQQFTYQSGSADTEPTAGKWQTLCR